MSDFSQPQYGSPYDPVLPGIGNTQWEVSLDPGLMYSPRYVRGQFRDKYGDKWGTISAISNELVRDQAAGRILPYFLTRAWKDLKRFIEHRFNETQPWEFTDLNPRSGQWKYEHPEIVDSWYPQWDSDEDEPK